MARMGETCGVVTGAMMALGLKHGKTRPFDDEAKEKTYHVVHEFVDRFRAKHTSITCKELLDCDMRTPEGLQDFKNRNLIRTHCERFVKDSAEILEDMLSEPSSGT